MAWFAPRTWTDGETVTAAMMNGIRDSLKAIGDPWASYAPTWAASTTAVALGNGSLAGAYRQAGKTVDYRVALTMGSSTTYGTGYYTFSLPVAAHSALLQHAPLGSVTLYDVSAPTVYIRASTLISSTTIAFRDNPGTAVTNSVPHTFAVGDRIIATGSYEVA